MSTYTTLRLLHLVGVIVLGGGIIGGFVAELRVRRSSALHAITEGLHYQAIFMERLVFPAALLVGLSGVFLVLELGLPFFGIPWLTGMWLLFAFEFVEGNSLTRRHGVRVRGELEQALLHGAVTDGLRRTLRDRTGTFGLCLDLPFGLVMVSLGATRPTTWGQFLVTVPLAVAAAAALTALLLRIEPEPSERSLCVTLEQASS